MIKRFLFRAWITMICAAIGSAQAAPQLPAITAIATPAQPDAITLYAAPKAGPAVEQWETFGSGRIVRNVVDPTLTPVLPAASKATGAAVIVAPGGAFLMLSMDSEGYAVAHWLADHGVAAFVLKYRLNESPQDPNEYLVSLMKLLQGVAGDQDPPGTPAAAIEDAQAAMRMVRSRAAEWKINPSRVGFVGFSAGAALTLSIGIGPDHAVRPDFIAPIYGPLGPMTVPSDAPPMFTALAADDPLLGKSRFELVTQWRDAHRPVEFHYFEKGGHGFGMHTQGIPTDHWIDRFTDWLQLEGFLKK